MNATTACTICIALAVLLLYVALGVAPDDGTATTTTHVPTSSTSRTATTNGLFCYAVATRAEAPLLRAHHEARSGIFGCDAWVVFSNANIPGVPRVIRIFNGSMDVPVGGDFQSRLNAPLLKRVWRRLPAILDALPSGDRLQWIVKADADTCFSPARLAETHRSMDSDGSDDSFSPLRGVRASSPLRGARAPSPLARQWILGATPIGHP